jgi:hypothetical protein
MMDLKARTTLYLEICPPGLFIVGVVEEVLGWDPPSWNNYKTLHCFRLSFMVFIMFSN